MFKSQLKENKRSKGQDAEQDRICEHDDRDMMLLSNSSSYTLKGR